MTDKHAPRLLALLGALAFLTACASAPFAAGPNASQQGEAMVAAADPRAAEAGLGVLREGGSAVDAAIAAMLVLGLVEPQSAGLGGGGFLLTYEEESERIEAFDGRERAPAGAHPEMFLGADGRPLSFREAAHSGLSIGTPSLIAMLHMAHERHGRLPWSRLAAPAIALAEDGFVVSPRLHQVITLAGADMRADPAARAYFFTEEGAPLPAGFVRANPAYAATLRAIVAEGPRALTHGPIADDIVAAARRGPRAGTLTHADLQNYAPRRLEPICGAFRIYRVCGMPPPSSGGVAVLSILGAYERLRPQPVGRADADDWSAFLWASRMAYADRDYYIADDTYAPGPARALIDPRYLDARAASADIATAPRTPILPGDPSALIGGESFANRWGRDDSRDTPGTTHISVVAPNGDAAALTATIEAAFGAQRMAGGFLLNNELTDFSFAPRFDGKPVANAPAPGKRPRSSMAPTIVTDEQGELVAVIGSPGGSGIIAYVARALIETLDWGAPMQEAIEGPNVVAQFAPARVENTRMPAGVLDALAARGWRLQPIAQEVSGLHGIRVTPEGLDGGADPRREGAALRLAPAP